MRLIAFITEGVQTGKILDHIGVDSEPRAYPRHALHRCGMNVVMRSRMTGRKLSRTGIWRRNRHRPMRSISASAPDAPVATLWVLLTALFHGEPATRAGNPGVARGSKPVADVYTAARAVEWHIR